MSDWKLTEPGLFTALCGGLLDSLKMDRRRRWSSSVLLITVSVLAQIPSKSGSFSKLTELTKLVELLHIQKCL